MSTIPSRGGPSCQSHNVNYSHSSTSYGTYSNQGQHATEGGIIYNYQSPSNPLEELRKRCSPSAAFDSAARFDPPRCAESTRLGIIQIIQDWINDDAESSSLFWLHGGAGVGKSALAQSLSEMFQNEELAASFFFFRGDPTRNNGNHLIPTLVSQLVTTFKEIVPLVEDRIRENWDIFTKIYQIQIRKLLIEPLLSLKSKEALISPPRLIVIDGLDECENTDIQCELLRAIARAIFHIPYPLRFLITSRPEAHITHVFNRDPDLQNITVHRYNLSDDPDADMDIRRFLETEFMDIRRVHRLGQHLPPTWPDQTAITSLVDQSSGHFIYASTVIRYIRSPKHRPDDRLEVILRLRPPQEEDRPYAQLDALYALIFEGVENHSQLERICLVLGILHLQSDMLGFFEIVPHRTTLERLLDMKAGDLVLLLDPVLSLVAIDGVDVRILHKSLFDFLLNSTRSGDLPFDLARAHESVAMYILEHKIAKAVCAMKEFSFFSYHCQYAYLNDTLKAYLHSLEVPSPEHILPKPQRFPVWDDDRNVFLRKSMWRFLRTLSRNDFDATPQIYEQYAAKWMAYLHSAVPRHTKNMSAKADALKSWFKHKLDKTPSELKPSNAEAVATDDLRRRLDILFKEWEPRIHPAADEEIDPVRHLIHIKQEHSIFAAFVEASFSGNTDTIVSSLVIGDNFIHSYSFDAEGEGWPLLAHTYSKHSKLRFRSMWIWAPDIAQQMLHHLKDVEQYWCSNLNQKYGIRPDFEDKTTTLKGDAVN